MDKSNPEAIKYQPMSEWAEDMSDWRERKQKKKEKRRKTYTELIELLAGELEFEYVALTEYQFRIKMPDGRKLDFYPSSLKAVWVGTSKSFVIHDIEKYLTDKFKPKI